MHYEGQRLERFDAIIPRIGASVTFYGLAIVRQFEATGAWCLNGSVGSEHEPLVLEVNSSPGLEGIEKATGLDVAQKVLAFIEKKATPKAPAYGDDAPGDT